MYGEPSQVYSRRRLEIAPEEQQAALRCVLAEVCQRLPRLAPRFTPHPSPHLTSPSPLPPQVLQGAALQTAVAAASSLSIAQTFLGCVHLQNVWCDGASILREVKKLYQVTHGGALSDADYSELNKFLGEYCDAKYAQAKVELAAAKKQLTELEKTDAADVKLLDRLRAEVDLLTRAEEMANFRKRGGETSMLRHGGVTEEEEKTMPKAEKKKKRKEGGAKIGERRRHHHHLDASTSTTTSTPPPPPLARVLRWHAALRRRYWRHHGHDHRRRRLCGQGCDHRLLHFHHHCHRHHHQSALPPPPLPPPPSPVGAATTTTSPPPPPSPRLLHLHLLRHFLLRHSTLQV